jgi:putative restriction endonuclease
MGYHIGHAGDSDQRVRTAAFAFLAAETALRGETLPRTLLEVGFEFEGGRVRLVGPQGIFKPAILPEMPLTITTAPIVEGRVRPYDDEIESGGLIRYRYRGTDPEHHENVGLRKAMERRVPLIYLYGLVPGEYLPVWPVFVVGDDRSGLCFHIAVDSAESLQAEADGSCVAYDALGHEDRRQYITVITQQRLHQQAFRVRVLRAYQERCAVCRLRHRELLDAAHILPDKHPRGTPVVRNGLSLCKLHHAAFDSNILGVNPDLVVHIRGDILDELDGPMLIHGLQELKGERIAVPRQAGLRPDRDRLAERFELFRKAG